LMYYLGYRPDAARYGHEILWDIYYISLSYKDMRCHDALRLLSGSVFGCVRIHVQANQMQWHHRRIYYYVVPLETSGKLYIPLTDQITEIRLFSVSIFYLILSGTSSLEGTQID
jgi:hypothetical protein